jgi:hypothetical protein
MYISKPNVPVTSLLQGIFFISEHDVLSNYLIKCIIHPFHTVVKIFIVAPFKQEELLKCGTTIWESKYDAILVCSIDLWGKYFFPKFNNKLQCYYDDKQYYNRFYESNQITSLMECINYAIEYGLKTSKIVPY